MIFSKAMRPRRGEVVSGDAVFLRADGERVLFALIDGLGHGEAAQHAAELGVSALNASDPAASPADLMSCMHSAMRGSRGAAATLGVLKGTSLEVVGVGNVELRCRHAYVPFAPTPGIVGLTIRRLRTVRADLPSNARLFAFSDGISRRMDVETVDQMVPDDAVTALLERYGTSTDDASILCIQLGTVAKP